MNYKLIILVAIISTVTACGKREQLKAKIFERKELKGNRLLIKYEYKVKNIFYVDSATIKNAVINTDSILLIIDSSNPAKSIPDIIK